MTEPKAAAIGEIEFNDIDVRFGRFMSRLAGANHPELAAAAALASRARGNGDVCVRLGEFAGQPLPELDFTAPALPSWIQALRECSVVGAPGDFRPLVLDDKGRLYLYRYWGYEKRLADNVLSRASDADDVDARLLRKGLERYFPDANDIEQKLAAATAVLRRFCVISGGPGTGKTTTVVKILALLAEQAGGRGLAIALAAPTGKAAARVQDAMRAALGQLELDLFSRETMPGEALTIHRLLGARADSMHYRHHRGNPLPVDVLVVDEASMADLALTTKLLEALPPHTRVILLGDKDQLASVEAGAVLGDICRTAGYSAPFAKRLASVTGIPLSRIPTSGHQRSTLSDSIALLNRSYRFGAQSGIGTLARVVNEGRGEDALALVKGTAHADVAWRTAAPGDLRPRLSGVVRESLRAYFDAVRANAAPDAIFAIFNEFRVLCAHRTGRFGAIAVNRIIEELVEEQQLMPARGTWYAGRPVMITRNDYGLRLFNGDVGIALPDADGRLKVFFYTVSEGPRSIVPARLPEHETAYAMTIHKAQGSEFGRVLLVLPNELSPIMTRELVYTGLTRAIKRVELWGTEAVFSAAIERRLVRASALEERLWSEPIIAAP
jgi:exodeoxyribonuclease V alpha subunit